MKKKGSSDLEAQQFGMTRLLDSESATDLDDISDLKISWVKTRDQLNGVEANNIEYATRKHLQKRGNFEKKCLNESYLLKLHRDMFGKVWNWAGKWRRWETNIGIAPYQIPSQISELFEDLKYWESSTMTLPVFERSQMLHHRLVKIHPFVNGNGKLSRLFCNIYLVNHDHPLPKWPNNLEKIATTHRKSYLQALKSADKGDYKPLLLYMKKLV